MRARTLIIIPAFNEQASLPTVLADVATTLPGVDVLVVDDGSRDATARSAIDAGVRVAVLPYNLGVGGALRTGFRYAIRHGYTQAVQLDADGQHDPAEVPSLLAALEAGADLVVGSRFAHQESTYQVGRTRGGAMWLLRLLVKGLSGQRFTDTSSGFRGFSTRALELFARDYPVEYLGDTVEALLLASYADLQVVEVPVHMRVRAGGEPSTRNVRLLYHYFRLLITIVMTASPRRSQQETEVLG